MRYGFFDDARRALDGYACRHGLGYTLTGSTYLGIEAQLRYFVSLGEALEIAPVVPEDWTGFEATRIFRGVTYRISVARMGRGDSVALCVDGSVVDGNVAPIPGEGRREVVVEVALGEPGDR